jgi:hypothetical protein
LDECLKEFLDEFFNELMKNKVTFALLLGDLARDLLWHLDRDCAALLVGHLATLLLGGVPRNLAGD